MGRKKRKKEFPIRIEVLIVLVFFLSFILWAMSKCNAKKVWYETKDKAEDLISNDPATDHLTKEPSESPTLQVQPVSTDETSSTQEAITTNQNTPPPTTPQRSTIQPEYSTKLFVTIDGLNMRSGPSLDSAIVYKLPIDTEVIFLNEVTDSTQVISLGDRMANEPWIKVKHK